MLQIQMLDLRARAGAVLAPIARRTPVSPNTLTLLALILNLGAAVALASAAAWRPGFLVAVGLAAIGGTLDVLDGVVARERGLASRWGDFLDHFADRVSDSALLAGWVLGARVSPTIGLVSVIAVLLNGYAGTQMEASFGAREYRSTGRGEFFIAILGFPLLAWFGGDRLAAARAAGLTVFEILTLMVALFALVGVVQRLAEARRRSR
jgi:archaetidylinositol phosphate synthase